MNHLHIKNRTNAFKIYFVSTVVSEMSIYYRETDYRMKQVTFRTPTEKKSMINLILDPSFPGRIKCGHPVFRGTALKLNAKIPARTAIWL